MSFYHIQGGNSLTGELQVQGAKNSVLPLLAASLLGKGETVLHNCPDLSDVSATLEILRVLGCHTKREGKTVTISTKSLKKVEIPSELMEEMRSSVLFLGALLAREKEACMGAPGGCPLGSRPIDFHLKAFAQLGVNVVEIGELLQCSTSKNACGKEIYLPFPSVGATENIMIFACGLVGTTTIIGAAREPEIVDLQGFLQAMGAKISGAGTSVITIEGGYPLSSAEFQVMGDRIVACTYLSAAAMTGGSVSLEGISAEVLPSVLSVFDEMGCRLSTRKSAITLAAPYPLKAVATLRTAPYPCFPTDAQALFMAMLTRAEGSTLLEENMFENRFHHVEELRRMGASIEINNRVARVDGKSSLRGTTVYGRDLRGTAALVVASLGAVGFSKVYGLSHLQRGYEHLHLELQQMGADITLCEEVPRKTE